MILEDILARIDELNSMCNYDCYYCDCGIDCSHTECYKSKCSEMSILDKKLFELLD